MTRHDELLAFFRTRFGKRPSSLEVDVFARLISVSNPDIMEAALTEAAAVATKRNRTYPDVADSVMRHYYRIVAAMAQLFPALFVFESAWRNYVAERLFSHYGADDWWHDVRDLVANERNVDGVSHLGGRSVPNELVRTLEHILKQTSVPCSRLETTYEIVEEATLFDLGKLIEGHWSVMLAGLNVPTRDEAVVKEAFFAQFGRVRKARNALYHHRIVKDRTRAVEAAAHLLDLLDVHMISLVEKAISQELQPLRSAVMKTSRHG